MTSKDQAIGNAVARLRGDKSQQWVADQMREHGFKWAQATVWNVEKGERPLRLAEAEKLADVLGTRIDNFTKDDAQVVLELAIRRMHEAYLQLKSALGDFHDKQVVLAVTADRTDMTGLQQLATEDLLNMSATSVLDEVKAERAEAAMVERLAQARAEGYESIAALEQAEESASEAPNEHTGPYLRMLSEKYHGEHPEA